MSVRLCKQPRQEAQPTQGPDTIVPTIDHGTDCTKQLAETSTLPESARSNEHEQCLVPHISLQIPSMQNSGKVPDEWGFRLGSNYTTNVMFFTHIRLKDKSNLGEETDYFYLKEEISNSKISK